MRVLTILLSLMIGLSNMIKAQTDLNRTDEKGNRIGYWIIKGADDKLIAKGRYNEGKREGEWKFYMSPIGRYAAVPDVIGNYEAGTKHGKWELTDSRSKITMKGKFNNGIMEGVWIVYDQDNTKLAAGQYASGIRQGQWLLFKDNKVMSSGLYENGQKMGEWKQDYFLEQGAVRVVGAFNYGDVERKGVVKYYKVERHPKFGNEELLVGTGTFLNGLKSGRWIEYNKGLKGEMIAVGYYDGEGRRTGTWATTLNNKPFREEAFNDGLRQGAFKSHYDNGNAKYSTFYENGMEIGFFSSFFENGKLKEKGAHTILENIISEDTIFYKIILPIEYNFLLVDEDYENLNYNSIDWIEEVDYSVPGEEFEKRWKEFLVYGKSKKYKIKEIIRKNKQSVRVGKYVQYFANEKVYLEGSYYPKMAVAYDPVSGKRERGFARDGEWKEYDEAGYLRFTYFYDKGELKKTEDSKGRPIDVFNNNVGG